MQEQYLFALHYPGDGVEWGMMMQRFMLALMLVIGGFIAGMQHFAHTIRVNATPVQLQGSVDDTGIAVVTGSGGRIEAGLTLLLAGEGGRMLISGIGEGVSKEDILRLATTDAHFSADEVTTLMGCCIDLGPAARNTRGNADETRLWAEANALSTIILVTADFHVPRALVEFRRQMPERKVVPHAVPTRGLGLDANGRTQWWQSGVRLLTVSREYGKYLASLVA